MSLRPSGCGGRRDAVPPHVEKRRRLSRPSSFIMGPTGAPSIGGRVGGGVVRKVKGSRSKGAGNWSNMSHAAGVQVNKPTNIHREYLRVQALN